MSAGADFNRRVSRALLIGCVAAAVACAAPTGDLQSDAVPARAAFPLVSSALERRCATLDCHGSTERNLRLYTGVGLRLDPADIPGSGSTTDAEHDASFRSVVALEPEILGLVVSEEGRLPERLTLVRKARGWEHHKAGAVIEVNEPADRCLTSWLTPAIDEEACSLASDLAPPAGWHDDEAP